MKRIYRILSLDNIVRVIGIRIISLLLAVESLAGTSPLDIERRVDLKDVTPVKAAVHLSEVFGIPVCFEGDAKSRLSIPETNVSLRTCLDLFAAKLPSYQWIYDTTNRVCMIYPEKSIALSWRLGPFLNTNLTLRSMEEQVGFRSRGVCIRYPSDVDYNQEVSITSEGESLAVLLNRLCVQFPWFLNWTLEPAKPGGFFWESAKRPILYNLTLRSLDRHVRLNLRFLGVADSGRLPHLKFEVDDGQKKASRLLATGDEVGGFRIQEYDDANKTVFLKSGSLSLSLTNGQCRSFLSQGGYATVRKWLLAPDTVSLPSGLSGKGAGSSSEDYESLILERSILVEHAKKFQRDSKERQVLERSIRSLDAEISSNKLPQKAVAN